MRFPLQRAAKGSNFLEPLLSWKRYILYHFILI
jgi:hypothetical protein